MIVFGDNLLGERCDCGIRGVETGQEPRKDGVSKSKGWVYVSGSVDKFLKHRRGMTGKLPNCTMACRNTQNAGVFGGGSGS